MTRILSLFCAAWVAVFAAPALAQPSAVHKETLQTQPFPAPPLHSVLVHTTVDPGGTGARHTHPGLELAYVVQGEGLLSIQGRPERRLARGDSFAVPPNTPHSVRNTGRDALVMVSTYVVDAGKPIASPAP